MPLRILIKYMSTARQKYIMLFNTEPILVHYDNNQITLKGEKEDTPTKTFKLKSIRQKTYYG